jgi:hypothetical protein
LYIHFASSTPLPMDAQNKINRLNMLQKFIERSQHCMGLKGLVLAAGEDSRLRPLTLSRPKHLIPLLGEPNIFIIHII